MAGVARLAAVSLAYELEIMLLNWDDLVTPNGAALSAPRF